MLHSQVALRVLAMTLQYMPQQLLLHFALCLESSENYAMSKVLPRRLGHEPTLSVLAHCMACMYMHQTR